MQQVDSNHSQELLMLDHTAKGLSAYGKAKIRGNVDRSPQPQSSHCKYQQQYRPTILRVKGTGLPLKERIVRTGENVERVIGVLYSGVEV